MMKRIMTVEDSTSLREMVSFTLQDAGHDVVEAEDGRDAIGKLTTSDVDMIITDMNMPRMNGLDFLQTLNREHPDLNVIMMTAFGGIDTYVEAMNLGVYEYLQKPIKIDELKSVMRKLSLGGAQTS